MYEQYKKMPKAFYAPRNAAAAASAIVSGKFSDPVTDEVLSATVAYPPEGVLIVKLEPGVRLLISNENGVVDITESPFAQKDDKSFRVERYGLLKEASAMPEALRQHLEMLRNALKNPLKS